MPARRWQLWSRVGRVGGCGSGRGGGGIIGPQTRLCVHPYHTISHDPQEEGFLRKTTKIWSQTTRRYDIFGLWKVKVTATSRNTFVTMWWHFYTPGFRPTLAFFFTLEHFFFFCNFSSKSETQEGAWGARGWCWYFLSVDTLMEGKQQQHSRQSF